MPDLVCVKSVGRATSDKTSNGLAMFVFDDKDRVVYHSPEKIDMSRHEKTIVFSMSSGRNPGERGKATTRGGWYDNSGGVFFQCDGSEMSIVFRTTSDEGVPVDEVISQDQWNIDSTDGEGPSGVRIRKWNVCNIFIVKACLLFGRLKMGVINPESGGMHFCHEFFNINVPGHTFMTRTPMPFSCEIESHGGEGSMNVHAYAVEPTMWGGTNLHLETHMRSG
jgi:hypothetical protein